MTARPALRTVLEAAEPFTEDIPREVPVTIAWAARDLVLPISQSATARERLPYAEHVVMPGVGHVPMFDDPGLVAEVILTGAGRSTAPAATVTHLTPRRTARGPASVARSRTG
jgi:pimeloyl-ACP methyl ester carboxylesterase